MARLLNFKSRIRKVEFETAVLRIRNGNVVRGVRTDSRLLCSAHCGCVCDDHKALSETAPVSQTEVVSTVTPNLRLSDLNMRLIAPARLPVPRTGALATAGGGGGVAGVVGLADDCRAGRRGAVALRWGHAGSVSCGAVSVGQLVSANGTTSADVDVPGRPLVARETSSNSCGAACCTSAGLACAAAAPSRSMRC